MTTVTAPSGAHSMSQSHSLSHSQMELWEQCPFRWKLTRLDRIQRAPAEALILGDALHAAIQADGERRLTTIAHGKLGLPVLVAHFGAALDARLAADDPQGFLATRVPLLRLRGLAMLRAYVTRVQPQYVPVAVEESFALPIPDLADTWTYTGRIDARTERAGVVSIVDFKTSAKLWAPHLEESKDQATAYLWADRLARRQPRATRVTFIVLSTYTTQTGGYGCTPDVRPTTRTTQQITGYARKVAQTARAMQSACETHVFPTKTGPLCGWCDCLGSCPSGQTWLRTQGRTPAVPVLAPTVIARVERQVQS